LMWVCRPVASFFLPSSNNNVERDCTTPDKSPGSCREITDCQTLGDFWQKPITKEKRKFLEVSTCGFANDVPKICCPIDTRPRIITPTTIRPTTPTSTTTTTTRPPTTSTTTASSPSFSIPEETTPSSDPFPQSRGGGSNLRRRGFSEWGIGKCSTEFCKEAFGLK